MVQINYIIKTHKLFYPVKYFSLEAFVFPPICLFQIISVFREICPLMVSVMKPSHLKNPTFACSNQNLPMGGGDVCSSKLPIYLKVTSI